jgi:MraZ protein
MLTGSYKHPLDPKGRCVVPKPLRSGLGETVYLTRGADGCVWLFPEDEWRRFASEIDRRSLRGGDGRLLSRFFLGTCHRVSFDRMGRVQIPALLREWAGLRDDVVIAGVGNRLEIWSPERWEDLMKMVTPDQVSTLHDARDE